MTSAIAVENIRARWTTSGWVVDGTAEARAPLEITPERPNLCPIRPQDAYATESVNKNLRIA